MPKDYFHLVADIVREQKYFDISLSEIKRQLGHSGKFSYEGELVLEDDGEEVTIPLWLHIGFTNGAEGWSIALVLHNIRIDCIDFEKRFTDLEGNIQNGWHRHQWQLASKTCEHHKSVVADLSDDVAMEDFLIRCFNLMGILLNRDDHGNHELQFN